jgi:hypothetical protein
MTSPSARPYRFLAAIVLPVVCLLAACQARWPENATRVSRPPVISPDYAGTTIAPNIAPLNFQVKERATQFVVRLSGSRGGTVDVSSRDGRIVWPAGAWRDIISRNRGAAVTVEVSVQDEAGTFRRFEPVRMDVAQEPLDRYLVYRLIPPLDHYSVNMSIYQRDVEGFSERPVIENQNFSVGRDGCMNCHTFRRNRPDRMSLQVRSATFGKLLLFTKNGVPQKVDTSASGFSKSPAAYQDWHPDGRHIAFSVNKVRPIEHTIGDHRDAWDDDSDLAVYDTDANQIVTSREIADPTRRENWPAWSADGRTLYFSSAPQVPVTELDSLKYDLMRIPYDPQTGTFGRKETVLSAADSGMSATQAKESPDGRWLLMVLAEHGYSPVYEMSSSLHVIDLKTGARHPLTAANRAGDSWHSWSSNGRWVAFASKRDGGVLARIYFTYFDKDGQSRKPFALPQEDPSFYDSCTFTFNLPELIVEPIPMTPSELGRAIATTPTLPAPKLVRQ